MSPVPRRWAAAAFLICCSLFAGLDRASALPGSAAADLGPRHEPAALAVVPNDDAVFLKRWETPFPGTKAFVGFRERGVIDLSRRDCLPNGTNFCFGDTVNFCANCGTCCVDGLYCCGSGGICCGSGCCASGQTCDQGKCVVSGGPVTVTSISFETVTRIATQVATVLVVVFDTSTVVSTTETTISNAETQTNVVWTTSTVLAKRAVPTAQPLLLRGEDDIALEPRLSWSKAIRAAWASVTARRLPHVIDEVAPLDRRQATKDPAAAATAQTTVTVFVTQTTAVTNVVSTTVTTQTTSFITTTVVVTKTIVLDAKATVEVTSVMTITSRPPVTQVVTTTQSPVITGTAPRTSSSSSAPTLAPVPASSSSIQTPAIVGIAVGGTVFAIIIASIVIFFVRHRSKRTAQDDNPNADLPPDVNALEIRQPSFPVLNHFAAAAPAAHHATHFQPPPDNTVAGAYLDPNKPSPNSSMSRHHRNSSGVTTLVGAPFFGAAVGNGNGNGNGKKADRVSAMTTASNRTTFSAVPPGSVVEVPGSEPDWYANDTGRSSGAPSGTTSPPPGGTGESPRLSQQRQPPFRSSSYGSPEPATAVSQQTATYFPNDPEVYIQAVEEAYQQTSPRELDGEATMIREMGTHRREEDDELGYLNPATSQGEHPWGSQQRYDGYGYGDPRSPSVAPPQP